MAEIEQEVNKEQQVDITPIIERKLGKFIIDLELAHVQIETLVKENAQLKDENQKITTFINKDNQIAKKTSAK